MGYVLDILYGIALVASSPAWLYRMLRHGRYRQGLAERLGKAPQRYGLQPVIWIHGVSVGEVRATRLLVEELHRQLPDYRVIISSTTDTGMEQARKLFHPAHKVFQWPLDFTWAVGRALDRSRPDLVVLMEGEAWPNFLAACQHRNIPTVIVNARMSPDKGFPRYRKLGRLAGGLFNRLTAIGVQDEQYIDLYLQLGVEASKLHLTGMMKYDAVQLDESSSSAEELARALGLDEKAPLWVAGGTGPGEESILLDVFERLRKRFPKLRLAIVPRKPERFTEVAGMIQSAGWSVVHRSNHPNGTSGTLGSDDVILLDTMGELRTLYALADVVFTGRSLVPMGGSDMIEPAALARPVCFGPHTFNFPQADDLAVHGCRRVADAAALEATLAEWLADATLAETCGQEARSFVQNQQGATRRNVELICHVLHRRPALAEGDIATEPLDDLTVEAS